MDASISELLRRAWYVMRCVVVMGTKDVMCNMLNITSDLHIYIYIIRVITNIFNITTQRNGISFVF